MLFSLSMFPVGDGDSLVDPVSEVVDEIDRAGLRYRVTGADTVIEGDWEEVVPTIRRAEQRLRKKHDRVYMVMTVDDHDGSDGRLDRSAEEVEEKLGRSIPR